MKPEDVKTIPEIGVLLKRHFDEDTEHFDNMNTFIERMEPFLKALEDNKIVSMKIRSDTATVVFYAKSVLTIGGVLVAIWGIIKFLLLK